MGYLHLEQHESAEESRTQIVHLEYQHPRQTPRLPPELLLRLPKALKGSGATCLTLPSLLLCDPELQLPCLLPVACCLLCKCRSFSVDLVPGGFWINPQVQVFNSRCWWPKVCYLEFIDQRTCFVNNHTSCLSSFPLPNLIPVKPNAPSNSDK